MRKEHAEHNEKICDHLILTTGFNDWVITTAFYSALHFVQHKIFPLTAHSSTYPDLNNYVIYYNSKNKPISKHSLTIKLVQQQLPAISKDYRWLFDTCMTARYQNYKIKNKKVTAAKRRLDAIKAQCI